MAVGAKEMAIAVVGDAFVDTLNKYGASATICFLTRLHREEKRRGNTQSVMVLEELLVSIPAFCAISEVMYDKPVVQG